MKRYNLEVFKGDQVIHRFRIGANCTEEAHKEAAARAIAYKESNFSVRDVSDEHVNANWPDVDQQKPQSKADYQAQVAKEKAEAEAKAAEESATKAEAERVAQELAEKEAAEAAEKAAANPNSPIDPAKADESGNGAGTGNSESVLTGGVPVPLAENDATATAADQVIAPEVSPELPKEEPQPSDTV